ncbi:MAG: TetR family transcriptional regulator [Nevskia sp.]|nr:TetR family transcriptional regulator [Nevskia sp.]
MQPENKQFARSARRPVGTPRRSSASADPAAVDRHDAILNAAERLFAASGFAATSMRAIAQGAGVVQSLLHYHFGTKEKLFEAVFTRRSAELNQARLRRLEETMARGVPELAVLLEILLRPTVELGRDALKGTHHFSRLIMSVAVSQEERDKQLMSHHFDAFALRFIDALQVVLPGLSRPDAVWGYLFSVGVAMTMMAPTGRADRLSGGRCDDADTDDVLQRVIRFAEAGLRASVR